MDLQTAFCAYLLLVSPLYGSLQALSLLALFAFLWSIWFVMMAINSRALAFLTMKRCVVDRAVAIMRDAGQIDND
jgi:hypothetical protein